jgi:homospermidine synthase
MGRRTDPSVLSSADPTTHPQHARLPGRLLIAGFGAIGRGVLPLLLRHLEASPAQVRILEPTDDGRAIAAACGVEQERLALTPDNHRDLLGARLGPGDVLLNLTVDVGSADLVAWCQRNGVLYLDAAIEPWAGGHFPSAARTTRCGSRCCGCATRTRGARPPC